MASLHTVTNRSFPLAPVRGQVRSKKTTGSPHMAAAALVAKHRPRPSPGGGGGSSAGAGEGGGGGKKGVLTGVGKAIKKHIVRRGQNIPATASGAYNAPRHSALKKAYASQQKHPGNYASRKLLRGALGYGAKAMFKTRK